MSADSHRRIAIAWPSDSRRLSVTERLLRARMDHHSEWSLWRSRPQSRIASPAPGASILTTSTPKSPSSVPTNGPASSWPNSIARRPVSGPEASASVAIRHRDERILGAQDVHAHDGLGALGRALGERGDELAMARLREGAMTRVAPERGTEAARDAGRGAQRGREPRTAGGLDQDRVEPLVPCDLVVDGVGAVTAAGVRDLHQGRQPL